MALNDSHVQLGGHPCPSNFTDSFTNSSASTVIFKLETAYDRFIHRLNFWIQAILVRLGPCLVLTALSALLVKTMRHADARLKSWESGSSLQRLKRQRATNRTTRMLLAVVILFLITEMPQGVVMLLGGLDRQFTAGIYLNLGDLFDILALVNSGINFVLFCTMSRQFLKTFVDVFCRGRHQIVVIRSSGPNGERNQWRHWPIEFYLFYYNVIFIIFRAWV